MSSNNETLDEVIAEIIAREPRGASNAIGVLLSQVRRLNTLVDDLNKEVQGLKRAKKRLRNPITGAYSEL